MGNAEYMGTHPIFESDFDCLTDFDRPEKCNSVSTTPSLRPPPPTMSSLWSPPEMLTWIRNLRKLRAAGLATVKAASRVSRIPLNSRRRPRVRPRVSLCFLMPSARMSNYKSKLHTEKDSLQFTQRSKNDWTTKWKLPMFTRELSRSTWLTGLSQVYMLLLHQKRKLRPSTNVLLTSKH